MELVLTIGQQEKKSPHTLAVEDGHCCQGPAVEPLPPEETEIGGEELGTGSAVSEYKGERSGQPHPSSVSRSMTKA